MHPAPIVFAATASTDMLVVAFLLVVIAVIAGAVAFWIVAAELGWLEPLERGDEQPAADAPARSTKAAPAAPKRPASPSASPSAPAPAPAPEAAGPEAAGPRGHAAPPAQPAAQPKASAAQAAAPVAQAAAPAAEPRMCREEEVDRATSIVADPETEVTVPAAGRARFGLVAAGRTDRGRKRPRNEDHLALAQEDGLFVVADGMGGYAGGLLAARLCCEVIVDSLREEPGDAPVSDDLPRRAAELVAAIQKANRVIHQRSLADPALEGMGTTVVCARFVPEEGRLYVGHVGDSRVYRLRDGRIQQLTVDHTMARFGVRGKAASALSRAVGVGPGVHVDLVLAEPRPEDVYLLCSDGLTKMVRNPELLRRVLADVPDPDEAAGALVQMANDAGGRDNITVVIVGVGEPEAGARRAATRSDAVRLGA